MSDFQRDWTVAPAPAGDDEDAARALHAATVPADERVPWEDLAEWQREAWRREVRDT